MRLHGGGGEDLGLYALGLDEHFEGQGVDDGGQHAHLVSVHAVEALAYALQAAEDVSASVHDGNLQAGLGRCGYFLGIFFQPDRIQALSGRAAEAFAREFQ